MFAVTHPKLELVEGVSKMDQLKLGQDWQHKIVVVTETPSWRDKVRDYV